MILWKAPKINSDDDTIFSPFILQQDALPTMSNARKYDFKPSNTTCCSLIPTIVCQTIRKPNHMIKEANPTNHVFTVM